MRTLDVSTERGGWRGQNYPEFVEVGTGIAHFQFVRRLCGELACRLGSRLKADLEDRATVLLPFSAGMCSSIDSDILAIYHGC